MLSQFNGASSNELNDIQESLIIENVFVLNAFYETMSKSFQPTGNKTSKKLPLIKLTPIISEQTKPEDTYKYVPLIDNETGAVVCMVCIKFWHSKNSSLESTFSKSNESIDNNDSNRLPQQIIPIYNPIYFYVFSKSQNFFKILEEFFGN